MRTLGIGHWLIILVIVMLVFSVKNPGVFRGGLDSAVRSSKRVIELTNWLKVSLALLFLVLLLWLVACSRQRASAPSSQSAVIQYEGHVSKGVDHVITCKPGFMDQGAVGAGRN